MYELRFSIEFDRWLSRLQDHTARYRITARLTKAAAGHFGDCAPVGNGVFEMRVHLGPGYRLYYKRIDGLVYFFLCGGEKSTQGRDIEKAIWMAMQLKGDT